jgi:hypothetical protein
MRNNCKWIVRGVVALAGLVLVCSAAAQSPVLTLDAIKQYYDGVTFDHEAHVDYAGNCSSCHHHTTGETSQDPRCLNCHDGGTARSNTAAVACQECHLANPYSASQLRSKQENVYLYHNDKPGLKAAYHRSCMGCHTEVGAPTGCLDCHTRNSDGDSLYRTGVHLPAPNVGKGH